MHALATGTTASMGEGTGGSNTADSYIGSLISLTSKSEIRYEGILYTVDTENSNIALQNGTRIASLSFRHASVRSMSR